MRPAGLVWLFGIILVGETIWLISVNLRHATQQVVILPPPSIIESAFVVPEPQLEPAVERKTQNVPKLQRKPPHGMYLQYYQTFPLERYHGLKCYTLTNPQRYVVTTANCNVILVDQDNITVEGVVIPRLSPQLCNRCYMSDFLSILQVLLFGEPEIGLEPLAPHGALIIEDDVLICDHALPLLDWCHTEQINCMLGRGTTMNYFAGPKTKQPHPAENFFRRYETLDQLYNSDELDHHEHIDQYLWVNRTKMFNEQHANHLNVKSIMNHGAILDEVCETHETLAQPKFVAHRFKDLALKIPNDQIRPIQHAVRPNLTKPQHPSTPD